MIAKNNMPNKKDQSNNRKVFEETERLKTIYMNLLKDRYAKYWTEEAQKAQVGMQKVVK
jgi:hypothetical protein